MRYVLLFLAFSIPSIVYCQSLITGQVRDAESKEPLPFVNISVQRKTNGTSTNIDGNFKLVSSDADTLKFSYVGYQSLSLPAHSTNQVFLSRLSEELKTIEIYAGENPAFEIIRRVIRNSKKNNPENLQSFSYKAYHKLYATAEGNFDTVKNKTVAAAFFDKHYLFLNESYSVRKYLRPGYDKETVLANKMSGVKDPFFAVLATNFQPFSFYRDHIDLLEEKYINPISDGTFKRYDFNIEDSIVHEADTTFIISFDPLAGKSFKSLKGTLYINSNDYALENVLAGPYDPSSLIKINIQQKYARIDSTWFPVELNTEIIFKEQKISFQPLKYVHRSYLSEISMRESLSKKDFGPLNVEFAPDANNKSDEYWQLARHHLSAKELNTYALYDSLPSRKLAILNTFIGAFEGIATSKFKIGKFYVPIEHLVRKNEYENLRFGFGLQTGERISELIIGDVYAAYGIEDRALKYGAAIQLNMTSTLQTSVRASYINDIFEPGAAGFLKPPPSVSSAQALRNWLSSRMDSVTRVKLQLNFKPLRFSEASLFVQRSENNPTYSYQYQPDDEKSLHTFILTEAGFQFKFVNGEKFSQIGNTKMLTGFKYPHFNFAITRSIKNMLEGDFSFTRIEAKFDYQLVSKAAGITSVEIAGGFVHGNAPYFRLFNGPGVNNGEFNFNSFVVPNFFQTMGVYEFTSDRYAYIFLTHNFGRLTGPKSKWVRPELSMVQNTGYGSLKNSSQHQDISLRAMDKGFYESGVLVTNLLRIKYVNFAYIGLGGGVFYRYGSYSFASPKDNLVKKISVTLTL